MGQQTNSEPSWLYVAFMRCRVFLRTFSLKVSFVAQRAFVCAWHFGVGQEFGHEDDTLVATSLDLTCFCLFFSHWCRILKTSWQYRVCAKDQDLGCFDRFKVSAAAGVQLCSQAVPPGSHYAHRMQQEYTTVGCFMFKRFAEALRQLYLI